MKWVRFFLKVATICNGCFLLSLLFRMVHWQNNINLVIKTIVILGFLVAIPWSAVTYLLIIIYLLLRRLKYSQIPKILFYANLVLLIFEVIYFFY